MWIMRNHYLSNTVNLFFEKMMTILFCFAKEVVVPEIVDIWHRVYLFYMLQDTYIFLKTKNLTGKIDEMMI